MAALRFTSILLLGSLFILLALGNSIADNHHDEVSENKLRRTTGGINPGSIDQDRWDGVPTAAAAPAVWNGKLGGRKMLVGNVLSKEMMTVMKQEGQMNNGEEASSSAKISGRSKISSAKSIGTSQKTTTTDFQKSQNYGNKQLEPKATLNSVDNKKTESQQKLFDEVANLLQKDYHGSNPRRKPPINNYMPLDEDDDDDDDDVDVKP